MTPARVLLTLLFWLYWRFVSSKWSGGGPGHHTYPHARWRLWQCEELITRYVRGH